MYNCIIAYKSMHHIKVQSLKILIEKINYMTQIRRRDNMAGSTLIILLGSLWFLTFGILILKSKKVQDILQTGSSIKDKEGYFKSNGTFNIVLGVSGLILGAADFFIKKYTLVFVIIFIIMMFSASIIQAQITKKYK